MKLGTTALFLVQHTLKIAATTPGTALFLDLMTGELQSLRAITEDEKLVKKMFNHFNAPTMPKLISKATDIWTSKGDEIQRTANEIVEVLQGRASHGDNPMTSNTFDRTSDVHKLAKKFLTFAVGILSPGLSNPASPEKKQLAIKYQKGLTAMEGKIPDLVCICVPKPDESGKR